MDGGAAAHGGRRAAAAVDSGSPSPTATRRRRPPVGDAGVRRRAARHHQRAARRPTTSPRRRRTRSAPSRASPTACCDKGNGKQHPKPDSTVEAHFTGWTPDGKMFDTSIGRLEPPEFLVSGGIAGWTEGLQLMVVGDKFRFWIPGKLAYDASPRSDSTEGHGRLRHRVAVHPLTSPRRARSLGDRPSISGGSFTGGSGGLYRAALRIRRRPDPRRARPRGHLDAAVPASCVTRVVPLTSTTTVSSVCGRRAVGHCRVQTISVRSNSLSRGHSRSIV